MTYADQEQSGSGAWSPKYLGRSGKMRRQHKCSLNWPHRGKYSVVQRALPYPQSEKKCRWRWVVVDGRRRGIPLP